MLLLLLLFSQIFVCLKMKKKKQKKLAFWQFTAMDAILRSFHVEMLKWSDPQILKKCADVIRHIIETFLSCGIMRLQIVFNISFHQLFRLNDVGCIANKSQRHKKTDEINNSFIFCSNIRYTHTHTLYRNRLRSFFDFTFICVWVFVCVCASTHLSV